MKYYGIIKDTEHVFPDRQTGYFDSYKEAKQEADDICHHLFRNRGEVSVDMVPEIPQYKEVRKWWNTE